MSSSTSGKPYRIAEDPICGRQLVAARKILAGELIIDEPALLTGPGYAGEGGGVDGSHNLNKLSPKDAFTQEDDSSDSVCLVCCVKLVSPRGRGLECPLCTLIVCSESCHKHWQHSENECRIFPKIRNVWESKSNRSKKAFYNVILVIRGLFCKLRDTTKWNQIKVLESKSEALEKVGAFSEVEDVFNCFSWDMFGCENVSVEGEVNGNNANDATFSKIESIVKAAKHCLGVLRTNAFSTFTESHSREGLFFLSSLMSHCCVINTDRQMEAGGCSGTFGDISGSRMVVRASVDIEKDEPISTTYLSLLYNTEERQRITICSWLFACQCRRCRDSTECQTFASGVICQEKLAQVNDVVVDDLSTLVCKNNDFSKCLCKSSLEASLVQITKSRPKTLKDISKLEDWLDQYDTGKLLHPNHSLFSHVKLYLCQYYGRQTGGMDALSVSQLIRKILYCQQILSVFNIVSPGIQMCRGIVLFELWCALRKLSELHHENTQITFPRRIGNNQLPVISMIMKEMDATKIKSESLKILKYALPNSPEEAMTLYLQEDAS